MWQPSYAIFQTRKHNKYTQPAGSAVASAWRVATMLDMKKAWVRLRDLPDDLIQGMPEHVRSTFVAARRHRFEVEMLCAGAKIRGHRRARRRFVLVADDLGRADSGGPLNFDLEALAEDVRGAPRLFVVSTSLNTDIYAAAYESAVEDLKSGHDVALVVETRAAFAEAWARTLAALQNGGVPTLAPGPSTSTSERRGSMTRWRLPSG
jgi:hypothetical protein